MFRRTTKFAIAAGAAMLFSVSAAEATFSPAPQVDFRDTAFSAADGQHSYTSSFHNGVEIIEFTLTAWEIGGAGGDVPRLLWWDPIDGIGIKSGEEDEIDENEMLIIQFAKTIGLSHVFLSDFFASENQNNSIYHEVGAMQLDTEPLPTLFDAHTLLSTDGNKANGEAVLELDKITPVNEIRLSGFGLLDRSEFAVVGFTDPVIPEPMSLALFGSGLIGLGLFGRRRSRRAA